jgi:hypothetical protein
MNISKRLLLITITIFGLQLSGSQYSEEEKKLSAFSNQLQLTAYDKEDATYINAATLIKNSIYNNQNLSKLMEIADSNQSDDDKVKSILKLENNEENQNEGYFSSMSIFAKAATAAALVLTVGIASYFYFMRPWSPTTQ